MTLLELCEPFFQYICRLNRAARKGGGYDAGQVRGDLRGLFGEMQSKSLSTPGLRDQYEKVRLPLVFFADYMIRTSSLPFANQWKAMAEDEEKQIFTGDELFFDLLDQTLQDRTDAATERLAVFYTCMGLGFLGYFENDPDVVARKMKEIAGRVRHMMDSEDATRICPESYEYTNSADLTTPPLRSLTPVVVALVALIVVLFIANGYSYWRGSSQLKAAVHSLIDKASFASVSDKAPAPASPQPPGK